MFLFLYKSHDANRLTVKLLIASNRGKLWGKFYADQARSKKNKFNDFITFFLRLFKTPFPIVSANKQNSHCPLSAGLASPFIGQITVF